MKGKFTVKNKSILAILLVMTSIFFSACGKDSSINSEAKVKDTSLSSTEVSIPSLYYRNVDFGMSKDDVISIEKDLTFSDDLTRTGVNEDHSVRCIVSNESVTVNDDVAIVSYVFMDDSLVEIDYDIDVSYPKSEIINTPAVQIYNKQTTILSDILGLPTSTESQSYSVFTSWAASWEKHDPVIMIYTNQSTDSFNNEEITDNVHISMAHFE